MNKFNKILSIGLVLSALAFTFLTVRTTANAGISIALHSTEDSENSDSIYTNPIIYADYSDPDVIRVGDDYFMTSSSFSHFPGLPILHSKDLVHWKIINHAVPSYPIDSFALPQHGCGIWAPSLRFHKGYYYIYFGDPDNGIYMTRTKDPFGRWDPLILVKRAKGWIDPCPLWDDDGNAYIVHGWARSRSGINSILTLNRMNSEGTEILDEGTMIFDGRQTQPTIEGPKFYKRNGFYYIFAPAGGVKTGWQTVLRSKNIYGPYEEKIVLEQGSTTINGPHQGAWIETQTGESWFIHFQSKDAYGRIIHLQPMNWVNDYPVMGVDYDGNGIGEPVLTYKKPNISITGCKCAPQTSDEFDSSTLGLQWQWQANPNKNWYSLTERKGWLRLFTTYQSTSSLYRTPSLLMQKFSAPSFTASAKIDLSHLSDKQSVGLVVFGLNDAVLKVTKSGNGYKIQYAQCISADTATTEQTLAEARIHSKVIYIKAIIDTSQNCTFRYSIDDKKYILFEPAFHAVPGLWVGAKIGLFAVSNEKRTLGYADIDYFRIK